MRPCHATSRLLAIGLGLALPPQHHKNPLEIPHCYPSPSRIIIVCCTTRWTTNKKPRTTSDITVRNDDRDGPRYVILFMFIHGFIYESMTLSTQHYGMGGNFNFPVPTPEYGKQHDSILCDHAVPPSVCRVLAEQTDTVGLGFKLASGEFFFTLS